MRQLAARVVTFGMKKRPKYRNTRVQVNGEWFHSKREASRLPQLRLLERDGSVRNIKRQVKYRIVVNEVLICTYIADYVYEERARNGAWSEVVEDVKGYANDRWPMKKKLMRACFGIVVRET